MVLRLLLRLAKVPGECEVHLTTTALVDLMTGKGLAAGKGFPLTAVEHIATIERQRELTIHKVLTYTKVYVVVALAITLRDNLARAVTTAQLDRNVVRQDKAGLHTGVPGKVGVALATHRLVVYHVVEAIKLVVIGIDIGGEVQYAEQLVLDRRLDTRTLALGHVTGGRIHPIRG